MPEVVQYYTTFKIFDQIFARGAIKPDIVIASSRFALFSTNEVWEEMSLLGTRLSMNQLLGSGVHLLRLTFPREVAPYDWPALCKAERFDAAKAEAFEKEARHRQANPAEWRCSLGEVSIKKRIEVRQWGGHEWVALPG
jgi:hypothetical protein